VLLGTRTGGLARDDLPRALQKGFEFIFFNQTEPN
jgi:hypothetical protein